MAGRRWPEETASTARMHPDRQLDLLVHQVTEHAIEATPAAKVLKISRTISRAYSSVSKMTSPDGRRTYPIEGGTASSPRFALASQHRVPDQVQLCLVHRSLHVQQQPVVVEPGS